MIQGTRRDLLDDSTFPEPGEYGKGHDGEWYGCLPVPVDAYGFPLIANLSKHQVIEHDDGTLTVSPSILTTRRHTDEQWHGYLDHGVWRKI